MLRSFSEFKFYQSFRIPVEKVDGLRFLVELEDERGKSTYIEDAVLIDMSVTGLGFSTRERILNNARISISLQFKKTNIDISGKVVRAFTDAIYDENIIYGIEIEDDKQLHKLLEQYILSFSPERLKDCLIHSALRERYTKASDGFEMFSLLLSLFKDITNFGDKDGFLDNMVEEMVRLLNAQRASIFLINPESNELEAVSALGVDKGQLKFDYRLGIAGSVFTTGVALNIDTKNDASRFNENFDKKFGFDTKSIICYPIHNREDKIIGVIEVINKRNQDRFSVEDEKTMKVLTLVFSSVFHNYNPISESSQIRRFSTPFDRKYAFIGRTTHVNSLRNTIIRLKDLEQPVLVEGEKGVGKSLYASILHHEGQRGLKPFFIIDCGITSKEQLEMDMFGTDTESKLSAKVEHYF
jgi:Nif-specific regulatory protein